MPSVNNGPNVERYQQRRLSEGKCRRCGNRPRLVKKNGRASPYCAECRARATAREVARLAERRAAGQKAPSPASRGWAMHLAAPNSALLTACGALKDGTNTIHVTGVTCKNCKRTAAYRIAGGPDTGPAVAPGPVKRNGNGNGGNGNGAADALIETQRRAALMGRRCANCRAPLSAERLIAEIEFCPDCQPAGMI